MMKPLSLYIQLKSEGENREEKDTNINKSKFCSNEELIRYKEIKKTVNMKIIKKIFIIFIKG